MSELSVHEEKLRKRSEAIGHKILENSRVYLSGPMDFVKDRSWEKENGWRVRVSQFLEEKFGTTIFDPWEKPEVIGMRHYGKEDEFTTDKRNDWSYADPEGDRIRAELADEFWPTLHIDLRMVDVSDFLIAYCPTNVYSVGTVHEIVMARLQHKPVLFVSPRLDIPGLSKLEIHLKNDAKGLALLDDLKEQNPIKPNLEGIPSLWYMALVDAHYFFDGFGFGPYMSTFGWKSGPIDARESRLVPQRPLLPYLEKLHERIPMRYDVSRGEEAENADWLVFDPREG